MSAWEIVRYLLVSGAALAAYAVFVKEELPEFAQTVMPPLLLAGLAYYVAWRTRRVLFAVGMSWASFFSFGLVLLCASGIARLTGIEILDRLIAPQGGDGMTLADDVRVILTGVATVPVQFLAALIATRARGGHASPHAAEP